MLVGVVALLALVSFVIGFVITPGNTGAAGRYPGFTPVRPSAASRPASPPGTGAVAAFVLHATVIRASPRGNDLARLSTHTEFGSREVLWVVRHAPGWLGVISPLAGNGRIGWIRRSAVSLTRVPLELRVSLSARQLTVLDDGKVVRRYAVAIGRRDAPTPTGRFAVTDLLLTGKNAGAYGCCILALSARAPHAIEGWSGGDRIAIHSTADNAGIGELVSHGCIRVTLAESRWLVGHIPLGTPTLISD